MPIILIPKETSFLSSDTFSCFACPISRVVRLGIGRKFEDLCRNAIPLIPTRLRSVLVYSNYLHCHYVAHALARTLMGRAYTAITFHLKCTTQEPRTHSGLDKLSQS